MQIKKRLFNHIHDLALWLVDYAYIHSAYCLTDPKVETVSHEKVERILKAVREARAAEPLAEQESPIFFGPSGLYPASVRELFQAAVCAEPERGRMN